MGISVEKKELCCKEFWIKKREAKDVQVIPYEKTIQNSFRALNEEWISNYFVMEEADYKALDNPEEYILDKRQKDICCII